MSYFERIVNAISKWLNWIAAAALMAVMFVVVINVVGRGLFEAPLKGTVDMVKLLGALVLGWAIAYTQVRKGNITIELLVSRFPEKAQSIIGILVYLVSTALFAIITWQTFLFAVNTFEVGELSEVIRVPEGPFVTVVGTGCLMLTIVLLIDFIKSILTAVKK